LPNTAPKLAFIFVWRRILCQKIAGPVENQDEGTDPLSNSMKNATATQEHILKSENMHETIANFETTVWHVPYRFTQEVRKEL